MPIKVSLPPVTYVSNKLPYFQGSLYEGYVMRGHPNTYRPLYLHGERAGNSTSAVHRRSVL
jgi:hypothetical protein